MEEDKTKQADELISLISKKYRSQIIFLANRIEVDLAKGDRLLPMIATAFTYGYEAGQNDERSKK
jgi:hypothetical protein